MVKGGCRERGRTGAHAFIRVHGRAFEGFCAEARSVNSDQKSGLLWSPMGVFSKGCIKRKAWEVGEMVYHGGREGSHQEFHLLGMDSGCYLGHALARGGSGQFKIPTGHVAKANGCRDPNTTE